MSTNMTILKSPEYPSLRICNADDAKLIDWICTCSKLFFQPESNKYCTKAGKQKHIAQRREIKTESCRNDEITKINERKLKILGNHLFNLDRRKNNSDGWFWVKIDHKSPLSIDKKEKKKKKNGPMARVWEGKKREKKGDQIKSCARKIFVF